MARALKGRRASIELRFWAEAQRKLSELCASKLSAAFASLEEARGAGAAAEAATRSLEERMTALEAELKALRPRPEEERAALADAPFAFIELDGSESEGEEGEGEEGVAFCTLESWVALEDAQSKRAPAASAAAAEAIERIAGAALEAQRPEEEMAMAAEGPDERSLRPAASDDGAAAALSLMVRRAVIVQSLARGVLCRKKAALLRSQRAATALALDRKKLCASLGVWRVAAEGARRERAASLVKAHAAAMKKAERMSVGRAKRQSTKARRHAGGWPRARLTPPPLAGRQDKRPPMEAEGRCCRPLPEVALASGGVGGRGRGCEAAHP